MTTQMDIEPSASVGTHLPDILARVNDKDLQTLPKTFQKYLLSVPIEVGRGRPARAAQVDKAAVRSEIEVANWLSNLPEVAPDQDLMRTIIWLDRLWLTTLTST